MILLPSYQFYRKNLAVLLGKQPLDFEKLVLQRNLHYLYRFLKTLSQKQRHVFDNIDNSYPGRPLPSHVSEVVVERVEAKLEGVFDEEVEPGLIVGVCGLKDYLEL